MSKASFPLFIAKFPEIEMPLTLGEDEHHVFSTENLPLSEEMVAEYILPYETVSPDEFTEYLPCFSIAGTEQFVGLVYWKASLLTYEYVLLTYTNKGQPISRQVIARTTVEGSSIHRAIATIDEDLVIFVAEGDISSENEDYDPLKTKTKNFEILANGAIV